MREGKKGDEKKKDDEQQSGKREKKRRERKRLDSKLSLNSRVKERKKNSIFSPLRLCNDIVSSLCSLYVCGVSCWL